MAGLLGREGPGGLGLLRVSWLNLSLLFLAFGLVPGHQPTGPARLK